MSTTRGRWRSSWHPVLRRQLRGALRGAGRQAVRQRVPRRAHADPLHAVQQLRQVRRVPRDGARAWEPPRSPPVTTRASCATSGTAAVSCWRGVDHAKDQTYFLFGLTQEQLSRAQFPLGGMTKPEVRELAREMNIAGGRKGGLAGDLLRPERRLRGVHRRLLPRAGHRARRRRAARSWTAKGMCSASTRACITLPSGSARDSASPRVSRSTSLRPSPLSQRVIVGRNDDLLRSRPVVARSELGVDRRAAEPLRAASQDPQQARCRRAATITPVDEIG